MTLLIEATLNGHLKIIKHLLKKCNINLDAKGKVKHFGSVVDGATALWCAAGQYTTMILPSLLLFIDIY